MGEPMDSRMVTQVLGINRDALADLIEGGHMPVRLRIGETYMIFDSDDVAHYRALHEGTNYMSPCQLAHYLGLSRSTVQRGLQPYATQVVYVRRKMPFYDIDSPIMRHIFARLGWDKYVATRKGEQYATEDERRAAAKDSCYRRTTRKER